MRPALKAGLLPVWRDRDTLQFGIDPRRAVALRGLGPAAAVISLLDGSRDRAALIATAQAYGIPAEAVSRILALLAEAGVLDDFPSGLHACLPDRVRARLAPELASASLAYADSDGGARVLARRRAAFVRVHGVGRTGACVATFLAASGVGHVACADPGLAEPADLAPAGLIEADLGEPRQDGAARAVGRAAPDVRTRDDGAVPDLVVLTVPALPDLTGGLMRDRVAHLNVWTAEAIGVIGPLVRPGRSACLRCVDLRKTDADPAWPKITAQATLARAAPSACDTVLAATAAALAAAQALAFIDRGCGIDEAHEVPVTVNGTLEVVLPDWQWRRRTWPPHPACGCGGAAAASASAAAPASAAALTAARHDPHRNGSRRVGVCRNGAVTDAP
jgi:bacteriocin biosynthesis cyclodehydratase domain-containing protein